MTLLTIYGVVGAILAVAYMALDVSTRGIAFSPADVLKWLAVAVLWLPALTILLIIYARFRMGRE